MWVLHMYIAVVVSVLLNPMVISQAKALLGVEVYLLSIVRSNFDFRGYSTKHALLMRTALERIVLLP